MDDLSIQGPVLERTLYEIELVNRALGGYGPSIEGLRRLRQQRAELTVLDVGTGSGDIPRELAAWGRKVGCRVRVTGIDLTETTIAMAQRENEGHADLEFVRQDLFELPDEPMFDVVHAAATLHHFVGADAQRALAKMHRLARLGVVINDFHRHPLAWLGIRILTTLFSEADWSETTVRCPFCGRSIAESSSRCARRRASVTRYRLGARCFGGG